MYISAASFVPLALCASNIGSTYAASLKQRPLALESIVHSQTNQIDPEPYSQDGNKALGDMLNALETMQETYFVLYGATWPDAIDWTAAVMGTHVSSTLSSLILGLDMTRDRARCTDLLDWENTINKYYTHTSLFFFAENAFAIRNQAYDDMLWVVLGWLENIKFAESYAEKRWRRGPDEQKQWHGLQMTAGATHRARIFYELASEGWDTSLCKGGMNWNPALTPYKNAITNELFAAASIAMYLYCPGDNNTAPFMASGAGQRVAKPHNPIHLENAIKSYKWLKESGMISGEGLYQDGFHVTGWRRYRNGTIDPGTETCDDLNEMVYTYNQGVVLSASRGLWLATGARSYLEDGHELINNVMRATGWPYTNKVWRGLGRGGVLEEYCDRGGYCSQDGQTFKGIFFSQLTEFCRPLWPQDEEFISLTVNDVHFDKNTYRYHLERCAKYGKWVQHNAEAALATLDNDGLFGMWWGISPNTSWTTEDDKRYPQELPTGADDHLNIWESSSNLRTSDLNRRGRGRTVETQSGGLAVLRAQWQWQTCFT